MADLFIGVWRPNMDHFLDDSLTIKLIRFRGAVNAAYVKFQDAALRMGSLNPVFLFVAPEYYFVHDRSFRLLTVVERDDLYRDLSRVSAGCPNMLVFAGTVNWKMELGVVAQLVPGNRRNNAFGGTSTAPVFEGGVMVANYDKRMNDGNIDRDTDAVFLPGNKSPLFNRHGLSFGIEVCGDFAESRLQGSADAPIDVEVLMSGSIGHGFSESRIDRVPVRDGGAFIHCDASSAAAKNGVWLLRRGAGWHGSADQFNPDPNWRPDGQAQRVARVGAGNVNKIAKLQPLSAFEALDTYALSI